MPELHHTDDGWKSKLLSEDETFTPAKLERLREHYPHRRFDTFGDMADMTELDLIRVPRIGRRTVANWLWAIAYERRWAEGALSRDLIPFGGWAWPVYPTVVLPAVEVRLQ